jgi:hypothetical protein
MAKNEDKSFWTIVGIFMALWGITEINGGSIWILSGEQLFPLFLVTVGLTMVARNILSSLSQGSL